MKAVKRVIKEPKYGAGWNWPSNGTVTIELVPGERFYPLYDVAVNGEVVGQIEKSMNTHPIPIKGSRLIRGNTKPRAEWRVAGQRRFGLWYETAGRAIAHLFDAEARRGTT